MTPSVRQYLSPTLLGLGLILLGLIPATQRMGIVATPTLIEESSTSGIDPDEWVIIREGTPFVVPLGRALQLTAAGSNEVNAWNVEMRFDGERMVMAYGSATNDSGNGTSVPEISRFLIARAGTQVEVEEGHAGLFGRAWGRLIDEARIPDLVIVHEGTPYIVPQGKALVVTALGSTLMTFGSKVVILSIDGTPEVWSLPNGYGNGCSIPPLAPHLIAREGTRSRAGRHEYRTWLAA